MMDDFLWWRDGVIYQIYPRSYADFNGSGTGDLRGIMHKLDYLQDLGVDAVWLSPIHPSPDVDFGYDVSDYNLVDPKFGCTADLKRLVNEADKRGIRLIMDLVLNHTSDQHKWFKQASSSRGNPYRDWYIWANADKNGNPPNNWQSVFGGKAWEWDEVTRQYYYHMFYKQQPDVNWRNPKVRIALLDVFRFWADKGVKGFRLDVFNVYFKDAQLRSNPTRLFGRRPFERQIHLYDFNQPELLDLLHDIRKVLDHYPEAYVVGETFYSTPEKAAGYCGADSLHATFNFDFLESKWDPQQYAQVIQEWEAALGDEKWPTFVLNNHDTIRSATRFGQGEDDERLKVSAALLLTQRGTPFLYYGEEIGMRDIRLNLSQIQDPVGKHYWPFYKGRDGCRAPMQWNASANAGFSTAQPWLPLHPDYHERNVEAQLADENSLLNFYKQLLAIRRTHPELVKGDYQSLTGVPSGVMTYQRNLGDAAALILLNFKRNAQTVPVELLQMESKNWYVGLSSKGKQAIDPAQPVQLEGNEVLILFSK